MSASLNPLPSSIKRWSLFLLIGMGFIYLFIFETRYPRAGLNLVFLPP